MNKIHNKTFFTISGQFEMTICLKDFLVVLLYILSFPALAQYSLSGKIIDDLYNEPIAQAEVFLVELSKTRKTDKDGSFYFPNLKAGQYEVITFVNGFSTYQNTVEIQNGNVELIIPLQPLSVELSQVVVTEEAEKAFALSRLKPVEGTAIYAGKKSEVVLLENLTVNAAANNARQIYSQVVGLNIYEGNDAGLQLNIGGRGLDPNRTASFNTRQNGYDISADVLGYPESYYSPPAEALHSIQVVRGAASLQYGTQFGGLVNFVFKKPPTDKKIQIESRQTVGSNQLFTSFNSLSGTVGKFSYQTFYNYKRGNDFRPNSGFDSHNVFVQTGYQISDNTSITAEFTYLNYLAQQPGGLTDAQFYRDPMVSNRERNWFAVDWQLYALNFQHRFSSRTNMSVQLFGLNASRDAIGFRTNRVSQTDDVTAPRDLIKGTFLNGGAEARIVHRYQLGGKRTIGLLGVKYYQSENTSVQGPGSNGADANFTVRTDDFPNFPAQSDFIFPNKNIAVFGEQIIYLNDRLSVTPGARFEYIRTESRGTFKRVDFDLAGNAIRNEIFDDNRVFNRNRLLIGLGVGYKPNDDLEGYFNFSQNYRSVTFNDIRVVNPSFQVDPNISDESGFTADIGARGKWKNISFDINVFGLLYDDRLGEVLRAETRITAEGNEIETGRVVRFRGNIGRALIYGLESFADWSILQPKVEENRYWKLNYFLNVAVTRSQYLESDIANVTNNEVEFIPLLNVKTGIRFGYKNLMGSLQFTRLSEQFTDASNAQQDRRDNQSGIVGTIPAYQIMDVSLSYKYNWWTLEAGVNNLLDEMYFTRRATGYPGPGIIPSLPRTFYVTAGVRF